MSTKVHPLADLFPLLEGQAFEELCADIQAHGLLNPIVQHQGLLLDGRNRLRACQRFSMRPRFVEFSSLKLKCTPEDFIWSQNMKRRHLTDDQRAVLVVQWHGLVSKQARERQKAAGAAGKEGGRGKKKTKTLVMNSSQGFSKADGKTRHVLAGIAQVSDWKVQQAEQVTAAGPELIPKVASGAMKLREAVKVATERDPTKPLKPSKPKPEKIWDPLDLIADIMAAIKDRVNLWPRAQSYGPLILELRHYADGLEKKEALLREPSRSPA